MTSKNVARQTNGRFANRGHKTEAAARDNGRIPVVSHDGRRSVGTHTGKMVREVNGDCDEKA